MAARSSGLRWRACTALNSTAHSLTSRASLPRHASAPLLSRSFSKSPSHSDIVTFKSTPTPEMDELLIRFRRKVLVPLALSPYQRNYIHSPENRSRLDSDPLDIFVGAERITLEYIDPTTDMPDTKDTLFTLMDSAENDTDWANIITFFESIRGKRAVKPEWIRRLVRRAVAADRLYVLLEALRESRRTGFTFAKWDLPTAFRMGMHSMGTQHQWDPEVTNKVNGYGKEMVRLMEFGPHITNPLLTRDPALMGSVLEPEAVGITRHGWDSPQQIDRVRVLAERLLDRMKEVRDKATGRAKSNTAVTGTSKPLLAHERTPFAAVDAILANPDLLEPKRGRAIGLLNQYLIPDVLPTWRGIALARRILKDDMPNAEFAREMDEEMGKEVRGAVERLKRLVQPEGPRFKTTVGLESWAQCEADGLA